MKFRIVDDDAGQTTVKLPAPAVGVLLRILEEMARGNPVTIIPVHAELTTQEAADMLYISRASLIQLLEEGRIEYGARGRTGGPGSKALMKDKRQVDEQPRKPLDELAAYDQELGI